ncbi:BTAD domain-containing putative transcriptional regulator [Lentzea californiensis]|uniref:BTAD domain-containing putative transcriptional regulator n=1 Tax=Lentzea californiensis TaxID=438851 RepID=UPI002164F057|nr:BTAD domain-containing putative transcriptional regulator [Lentzea californiensis]MCR3752213.1 putative ATPase [Lentzea californiensis]
MLFAVLGPLAVRTADGRPVEIPESKVRALLANLLAHRNRPVSATTLIEDLWGDELPVNPTGALQTKISKLRQALEAGEPGARDLVASQRPGYVLRTGADAVDADRFAALTAAARTSADPDERARLLTGALGLWRGAAFADFAGETFARAEITRLEEDRLVAAEELGQAQLDLGDHAALLGRIGDLVAAHPLRERLRALHMLALYRAGRQSEALASFREVRALLRDEQGLDPGEQLAELHRSILRHDPSLEPPLRRRTSLPVPLTELIGREEALVGVCAVLGSSRLVTLTGSGGVGKTRLAVEVATRTAERYPDGARLVELATISDGSLLASAVMAGLGIRDVPNTDVLSEALRARRMLLVLDNCEHVLTEVAALTERLLAAAPGLRVLTTSQKPLRIAGESVWTVAPLDLPPPGTSPDVVERSSAVRLFVARSAPSFVLDASNAGAVAELCTRLDGVPLALELAATRARSLGLRELLARLDDRFRLLAAGYRDAPPRQQTLRAMIDWSWEPLTEVERAVLRRLAAHSDGCTLAAAEAVCAGGTAVAADVLDTVAGLVDRSLVTVVDTPDGTRYRLLESVAAYCRERLAEAGETEAVQDAHRRYYTKLAETAEPHLRGPAQRLWLERLDAESANLRTALDTASGPDALRLVNALAWYWYLRGRLSEARRALSSALTLDTTRTAARARATAWHAGITFLGSDVADRAAARAAALAAFDSLDDPHGKAFAQFFLGLVESDFGAQSTSEDLVNRAQETFGALGDRWGVAATLSLQAIRAHTRGDLESLRRNGSQSLALFRELGDQWGQLRATEALGGLAEIEGDYEEATRLHRDGLRMAEELRLWPQAADRLSWLGRASMLRGDHAHARELNERALRLSREQSYKPGQIFAEINLGVIARRAGDLDTAENHLRTVLEWDWEPGIGLWLILTELGFVAEQRGDAEAARARHLEGLTVARALGDQRAVAVAMEGLAGACLADSLPAEAARLLGAAAAARRSVGATLPPAERADRDRVEAGVRQRLGDEFAAEYSRGFESRDGSAVVPR